MQQANSEQQARQNKLAVQARGGDRDALKLLVEEILPLLRKRASKYTDARTELEDLTQEGAIGLMRAVATYDPARGVPFVSYAILCAERRMISVVRTWNRQYGTGENAPVSFEELEAELPSRSSDNPEELLLRQETLRTVFNEADTKLSPLEKKVLVAYLESVPYGTIAARLGLTTKAVDNAMQRVRRKLRGTGSVT